MRTETTVYMTSGAAVDLIDPAAGRINAEDIADALSKQVRHRGAVRAPWTEAQHAVLVADILHGMRTQPRTQMLGLLYGAHRAYMGAVPRQLLRVLGPHGQAEITIAADDIDRAIERALVPLERDEADRTTADGLIRAALQAADAMEARDILPPGAAGAVAYPSNVIDIGALSPAAASFAWWEPGRVNWLDRYNSLRLIVAQNLTETADGY